MKIITTFATGLFVLLLGGAFALIAFVPIAAGGAGSASAALRVSNPSQEAINDIPPLMLLLFIQQAQQCRGLPWTVLAGISKVESNHGRHEGSELGIDGVVRPPIIGIPLDGTNGTARIPDTDNGSWDGDTTWDRAVGPFQFIPSSWRIFGTDGDDDGVKDPHNVHDAVPAMRRHLCPDGQITDLEAAIFAYNRSREYVALVLKWARIYTGPLTPSAIPIAGYALPVAATLVSEASLARPHHDYPASDLGIPVGTPLFAMVAGTVSRATAAGIYPSDPNRCGTTVAISGVDGASYTYCHLSQLAVEQGQVVGAGTLIGLSGGQPGTSGAGRTTGPHLHLSIRLGGSSVCPQPILVAIYRGTPINPAIAPSVGCITGRPVTNWPAWLDQLEPNEPQGGPDADQQPIN